MKFGIFALMQRLQRVDEALRLEQQRRAPRALHLFALRQMKRALARQLRTRTRGPEFPLPV